MLKIGVYNAEDEIREGILGSEKGVIDLYGEGEDVATIGIKDFTYEVGDKIKVTTDEPNQYYVVQLDSTLDPDLIYMEGTEWEFIVPIANNRVKSAVDTAFRSKAHYLYIRKAYDFEIEQYRNLALNTHDQKDDNGVYPHATANVETRDDSTFFAKNVIDGKIGNISHGSYPFQSWGINRQEDAEISVEFGREVEVDKLGLVLRADYPHDSYWTKVTVVFTNGSESEEITIETDNSPATQWFDIEPKVITAITLKNLIKADDDSPFPALTQLEVFGKNVL